MDFTLNDTSTDRGINLNFPNNPKRQKSSAFFKNVYLKFLCNWKKKLISDLVLFRNVMQFSLNFQNPQFQNSN